MFHSTYSSNFTFKDELSSHRKSKKTALVKLPPLVPPRCTYSVKIVTYAANIKVPFKADFKIGFSANFDQGSESWHENGWYNGEDDTNIKVMITCSKMPNARKVSKMINGLGEDM